MRPWWRHGAMHGLVGFVAMGGWAALANRAFGPAEMLQAGLIQGTLSALLTLYLKRVVELLNRRLVGHSRWWCPPLSAVGGSAILLTAIHWWAGTPALLTTLALPLAVSSSYVVVYNLLLVRQHPTSPDHKDAPP